MKQSVKQKAHAQPDNSGGAMLALYPDPATVRALTVPGGLPPGELHMTVVYAGKASTVDAQALNEIARALSERAPFTAKVSGGALFTGGEQDVHVALVSAPEIEDLRRAAMDRCTGAGIAVPREHGYTAHITRAYQDPDPAATLPRQETLPVAFTGISAVHGGVRTDYPFTRPGETIADLAAFAYAQGWARSGGPLTDRVKAGAVAAVALAEADPHTPGVLEATLRLGALEGMWAKVYARRQDLIDKQAAAAARAWSDVLTHDVLDEAVRHFRQSARLAEASDPGWAQLRAAALTAAKNALHVLKTRGSWQKLRTRLRMALAAGRAEGLVGAVAIAADKEGVDGLDWDLAFEDAYRALENIGEIWADADGWLEKILDRAEADLGRVLAQDARTGASYRQMVENAAAVLRGTDVDAVSFVVDWASTEALRQGALDLYSSQNVPDVDWITAGDERVCPICQANEDASPYAPTAYPKLPHPLCRCTPSASLSVSSFAAWFTTP